MQLLTEPGAADSNMPQALRGHVGFVDFVLAHTDGRYRGRWLRRIAEGALVDNAECEASGTFAALRTEFRTDGTHLTLHGEKYCTTGSLFADWIFVSAARTDPATGVRGLVSVQVSIDDPAVRIEDAWDGFRQRLTASGTAYFDGAAVTVSRVFEVGGASATARGRALDRLWRNARTVASHNPAIRRLQAVGDNRINGTAPSVGILAILTAAPPAE